MHESVQDTSGMLYDGLKIDASDELGRRDGIERQAAEHLDDA